MDIINVFGTIAGVAGLALSLFIAIKQNFFKKAILSISLIDYNGVNSPTTAILFSVPSSDKPIAYYNPIKITNKGNATIFNIEITIESESIAIVNYPNFLSFNPVVTNSIDSINGNMCHLGQGSFRCTYNIQQLHPSKSVQLNNVGVKIYSDKSAPIQSAIISLNIFQDGKLPELKKLFVWVIEKENISIVDALRSISKKIEANYHRIPLHKRLYMYISKKLDSNSFRVIEATELKEMHSQDGKQHVQIVDKYNISSGILSPNGLILYGPYGIIH